MTATEIANGNFRKWSSFCLFTGATRLFESEVVRRTAIVSARTSARHPDCECIAKQRRCQCPRLPRPHSKQKTAPGLPTRKLLRIGNSAAPGDVSRERHTPTPPPCSPLRGSGTGLAFRAGRVRNRWTASMEGIDGIGVDRETDRIDPQFSSTDRVKKMDGSPRRRKWREGASREACKA
jgi:hypothetical protein